MEWLAVFTFKAERINYWNEKETMISVITPVRQRAYRFSKIFIKKNKLGDRMIKLLMIIVICRCLADHDIFAQPRPIIVNCSVADKN